MVECEEQLSIVEVGGEALRLCRLKKVFGYSDEVRSDRNSGTLGGMGLPIGLGKAGYC